MKVPVRGHPDPLLFAAVAALCLGGLVVIYSASSVAALEAYGDAAYFLKRQLIWAGLGGVGLAAASRIHYRTWRRFVPGLLLLAVASLLVVLVPGVGVVVNGARRWVDLGPVTVQPVEGAKLALVLYLAHFLAGRGPILREPWRGVAPPLLVLGVLGGLVMRQPDMGSAVVLGVITLSLLFAAGARTRHLGATLAVGGLVALWLAISAPYRRDRLLAFLDPWRDPQGIGFHVVQSLIAIGSGGIWGVGIGRSTQKFFYLPERHTDFVFSILAEELGLVGVAGLVALYLLLLLRLRRLALYAPDRYGALLAAGVGSWIASQIVLNIGSVSGALPVVGVPLPFLSFGGSSLFALLVACGICLNLSRYVREPTRPGGLPEPGWAA
ncbi:MAG: putative lipid II flippase FtsW [Armatimonadetes bacterium]|nr:putative lipid II flippase FtsW [Armatimonadota bacterium]MDW8153080.1 putative lipid II flippase FtsW [Armatimonadota bacterium]